MHFRHLQSSISYGVKELGTPRELSSAVQKDLRTAYFEFARQIQKTSLNF